MGDTVDKKSNLGLKELVWCLHLKMHPNVIVNTNVPNLFVESGKFYIVAEEGKVKMICKDCFVKGFLKLTTVS